MAIPIGCVSGIAAIGFHHALSFLQQHILFKWGGFPFAADSHTGTLPQALFFLIPTLGGLAVGLLIHFVVPEAEGPGTDGLVKAFQPAVIASVIGFAIYRLAMPTGPFLDVGSHALLSWRELVAATVLGMTLVPFSLLFTRILAVIKLIFQGIPLPRYLKPALGGAMLGLIGMAMPQAIGTGWEVVTQVATGTLAGWFVLLILLVKMVTTSLTLGSGGSGGLFGPCLFLGTMLGGTFGWICHSFLPAVFTDPAAFALVGMGAFFAGAAKAPLAGIVMVCEMTGNYSLLPALLLASATHYGLSSSWTIYPAQRLTRKHSPAHRHHYQTDPLRDISIAECLEWEAYPDTLLPETPLAALVSPAFRSNPDDWPVIDESGKLCGILRVHHLLEVLGDPILGGGLIVEDVMEPPVFLTPVQDLSTAMELLQTHGLRRAPVLNLDGRLIGSITAMHILRAREKSTRFERS